MKRFGWSESKLFLSLWPCGSSPSAGRRTRGQMTNRLVGKSDAIKLLITSFRLAKQKYEWYQKKWSTPGLVSPNTRLWWSKVCVDLLGRWSSDNPLLSAANEVQRANERVNRGEGGLKQWLLYLIQHGFWGMKHAQPINDFLLFSPVSFRAGLACGLRLLHLIVSASLSSLTKEKP